MRADIKSGAAIEKTETRCQIGALQIGDSIVDKPVTHSDQYNQNDELIDIAANSRIVQK